jgi:hypothetical protein
MKSKDDINLKNRRKNISTCTVNEFVPKRSQNLYYCNWEIYTYKSASLSYQMFFSLRLIIISAVPLEWGLQVTTTGPLSPSSASLAIPLLFLMCGPPVPMVGPFCPPIASRGSQRDVVYLGWPIAPSYMSPNAGRGRVAGFQPMSIQLCTWSPNKLRRSNSIFNLRLPVFSNNLIYIPTQPDRNIGTKLKIYENFP